MPREAPEDRAERVMAGVKTPGHPRYIAILEVIRDALKTVDKPKVLTSYVLMLVKMRTGHGTFKRVIQRLERGGWVNLFGNKIALNDGTYLSLTDKARAFLEWRSLNGPKG